MRLKETAPLLQAQELAAGYAGKAILGPDSFSVGAGEIAVLLGPNGGGKSTLLRTLAGLQPPVAGQVLVEGVPLAQWPRKRLAQRLSVVLTRHAPAQALTCGEVAALGRLPHTGRFGLASQQDRKVVREAMQLLQVEELAARPFLEVSDGQRQRVLLARAVAQGPRILVLDEPTAYLDIRYKLELMQVLQTLAREKKLAILASLHEVELAVRAADRLFTVANSCVSEVHGGDRGLSAPAVRTLYGLGAGAYDPVSGLLELGRPQGLPRLFVLAGGGTGTPVFRRLQRRGIPFVAGVLAENDVDTPAARALACRVFTVPSFAPLTPGALAAARVTMRDCTEVICTLDRFTGWAAPLQALYEEALAEGKLVEEGAAT